MGKGLFSIILLVASWGYAGEYFVVPNGDFKSTRLNLSEGVRIVKTLPLLEIHIVESVFAPEIDNAAIITYKKPIPTGKNSSVGLDEDSTIYPDELYEFRGEKPWGIESIKAPLVWRGGVTGRGVKVLVLDQGVDLSHPEFLGKNIIAKDFTDTKISLGVPYPEYDDSGHGTHVAATILGRTLGVAPDAELYVGKVCRALCATGHTVVEAIEWGLEEGVDVINMSFSLDHFSHELGEHIFLKVEEQGVVAVAAAGNRDGSGDQKIAFPGAQNFVLTVGAMNAKGHPADFSNPGDKLDLIAPGVGVVSATRSNTGGDVREKMNGSSMAAPHVTGVVALLLSRNVNATPASIREAITSTAEKLTDEDPRHYGHGRLNALKALDYFNQSRFQVFASYR